MQLITPVTHSCFIKYFMAYKNNVTKQLPKLRLWKTPQTGQGSFVRRQYSFTETTMCHSYHNHHRQNKLCTNGLTENVQFLSKWTVIHCISHRLAHTEWIIHELKWKQTEQNHAPRICDVILKFSVRTALQ